MIDRQRVVDLFVRGDTAQTTTAKGEALADVIEYVFSSIPGITVSARNIWDPAHAEEIDIAFWNEGLADGLRQFPPVLLVECKNWEERIGNEDLVYFITKLGSRGQGFGVFVAARGITGDVGPLERAHQALRMALSQKCEVVVLTRDDLLALASSEDLVLLLKRKRAALAASGTCL